MATEIRRATHNDHPWATIYADNNPLCRLDKIVYGIFAEGTTLAILEVTLRRRRGRPAIFDGEITVPMLSASAQPYDCYMLVDALVAAALRHGVHRLTFASDTCLEMLDFARECGFTVRSIAPFVCERELIAT